jgi:hypothetical protein
MATETVADLERFHRFVGKALAAGNKRMSGEGGPIDWDALKSRVRQRLAQQGIVDEATRSA